MPETAKIARVLGRKISSSQDFQDIKSSSIVCIGERSRIFDGFEQSNHVIKQFAIKSLYAWMTALGSVPSSPFLDF